MTTPTTLSFRRFFPFGAIALAVGIFPLRSWGAAGTNFPLSSFSEASNSPAQSASEGLFDFSQRQWNQARESIEAEEHPLSVSTSPASTAPAGLSPGINVNLPYDSGLTISGRKLIALSLSQIRRKSAKRSEDLGVPQNENNMEMKQELQVRIKGKVGRKVTVNVDFDDTKDDKRDISVLYQGDPGEFVQEAAFGDLTLSLPSTEFVSFSKQLFGVRTKLQYKNATLMAIGSRTKGTTETKRFNGATKFERRVIPGHRYVAKQYYSVAFTSRPVVAGSEWVWLDDGNPDNNNRIPITEEKDVEDFDGSPATLHGWFDKLKPGDHYTFDAARGLLFLKRPVDPKAVLAIDYQFADDGTWLHDLGTPGLLKLAKTPFDQALAVSGTAHRRELKTFYSFGNIKLIPDNGLGNFILRTIDANQNEKVIRLLPTGEDLVYRSSDTTNSLSTLEVDFDQGVFNVRFSTGRFDPDALLRIDGPDLYSPTPTSDFSFLTEYKYRLRDFQLRPNLVFGSERVTVNGRLMRSEIDYFVDPTSGLLQFFNENELDENSQIEVTYDYAPFGGQLGQTLVGGRFELGLIPGRLGLGSTFLYTFAPNTSVVPDLRSTPSSLMVLEADGHMTDVEVPLTDLKLTLTGEAAQSRENPNLFGRALVDSMEGASQEETVVLDPDLWPVGANPNGYGVPTDPTTLALSDENLNLRDVVPSFSNSRGDEKLRVMNVSVQHLDTHPVNGSPQESSLLYTLPKGGTYDFSKKNYLEMWLEGFGSTGTPVDLWVNAGTLNEDANLDGIADTEDLNSDGSLNAGEDIGYEFRSWGPDGLPGTSDDTLTRFGADNGKIDAENTNAGVFSRSDGSDFATPLAKLSGLPPGSTVLDTSGQSAPITDLSFTGWRFIRIPLPGIASHPQSYASVQHLRLTFVKGGGGPAASARVRVGKLAFVGNTWESPVLPGGGTMTAGAVNNLDNPDYVSLIGHPLFNNIYGDQADNRTREQALELRYDLPPGSTGTTRSLYGSPRDFSHHRFLNFFLRRAGGTAPGATLVVQLGSETDYFEYTRPLGIDTGEWVLETLRLADRNNDGTPETLQSDVVGSSVTVVGSPNFSRIGQFKFGIRNETAGPLTGALWLNEIYLSDSRTRVGNARRLTTDGRWGHWGTFGATYRDVDRNFQTLTSPVVNQDREELSGYASLNKFSFMPLSGKYVRSKTVTPAVLQTGQSPLVSLLSEGREENTTLRGDGQLLFAQWPALSYSAERTLTESTDNQDRRDRRLYSGSLDYTLPARWDILPGAWVFRPLPDQVFFKYTRSNYDHSYFPERLETQLNTSSDTLSQRNAFFGNARVLEVSDEWSGRMGWSPWDGLVLTPQYSQRKVGERRDFGEEDLAAYPSFSAAQRYAKSFAQTQGLSGSWRIFPWLEPRLSFSQTGTETNGLPTASSTTAANTKSLDRTASGDLFLSLAPRDLFPKLNAFRSLLMDVSFRLESSDNYSDVPQDFTDWRKKGGMGLHSVPRRNGKNMYGLLSPLTFEGTSAQRKALTARNTLRYTLNWSPLDWLKMPYRLEALKTVNLNNTLTFTNEHTENTLTVRDVTTRSWPDTILTLRDTEKMFLLERWMSGSQMNVRLTRRVSETFQEETSKNSTQGLDYRFTLFSAYDVFLSLSATNGKTRDLRTGFLKTTVESYNHSLQVGTKMGHWRVTPNVGARSDISQDGTGKYLQDLQIQSVVLQGRFDQSYPGGFRFPFTRRVFANINRLTVDAKLGFERRHSRLNFERDNTDFYSGEATGEWELSKNFRFSFGGKLGLLNNRARAEDGSMTVQINSQLVIQF